MTGEKLAASFEDIEESIFQILTKKYILGLNLITGRSNLRSVVEIASELVIGVYLFVFIVSKNEIKEFPFNAITIAYSVKYGVTLIDTLFLIFKKVLSFFDILMNLVDLTFWVLAYLTFKEYSLMGLGDEIQPLFMLAIIRGAYIALFYILSIFVFARDDAVRFFYP